MTQAVLRAGVAFVVMVCRAQDVSPQDLEALRSLLRTGRLTQAREAASQLIDGAEKHLPTLLKLGQILGVAKEFPLSERAFMRAVEMSPDSYEAQFNLGFTRFQIRNFAGAAEPLEKAAALRPDSFDANYLLGATLSETGRKLEALRRLRTARKIGPQHAGALSLLGVLYLGQGYPLDAMETLDEARRLDPSRLPVWLALAEAGHDAFEFEKALRWASDAASRFPDSVDAHFRLGFELETAGRFDDARAAFDRALKLKPDHPEARLAVGRAESRAGNRGAAIEHFKAVLRAQPRNAMARLELAKALVAGREFTGAKLLLLAPGDDNRDPAPHLLLHQIYQAEGNTAESARQRARYLELTSARIAGGMSGTVASRKLRRFVP